MKTGTAKMTVSAHAVYLIRISDCKTNIPNQESLCTHASANILSVTGVTLPDSGIRDENGLEPISHISSLPERSPLTTVQRYDWSNRAAVTMKKEVTGT